MDEKKIYSSTNVVPPTIIDAIKNNRLVIFVGAGISALYGFPLWDSLANDLVDYCYKVGCITNSEKDTILHCGYSSVQKISIATYRLGKNKNGRDIGLDYIVKVLSKKRNKKHLEIAEEIGLLLSKFNSPIVTTNADLVLDNTKALASRDSFYCLNEKPEDYLKPNSITHIHGSIENPEEMIFTSDAYTRQYLATSPFGKKLQAIFRGKTVLFVGYGVSEFELIRYFFDEAKDKDEFNFFKLVGYLNKDTFKISLDDDYYSKLKIRLLPYCLEKKGYLALIDVLKEWTSTIEKESTPAPTLIKEVVNILKAKPEKGKVDRIAELIKDKEIEESFVNSELIKSAFQTQWIEKLIIKTGWFDTKKYFLPPIIIDEKSYRSSLWGGLAILRQYALTSKKIKRIDDKIISIIHDCSKMIKDDLKEPSILKRRINSSSIMLTLIEIITSRELFFDNDDSLFVIKEFMNSDTHNMYHLLSNLFKIEPYTDSISLKMFDILSLISINQKDGSIVEFLMSPKMELYVSKMPERYYDFALNRISADENMYFTMGAFGDFESNDYFDVDMRVACHIFTISAKHHDLNVVRKTINDSIFSDNEVFKKAAVCLIGVRFDECKDLLVANLETILNDDVYYADVVLLLKNNLSGLQQDAELLKTIKNSLETATFGKSEEKEIRVLRQNILLVLSEIDDSISIKPLTKNEQSYVYGTSKHFYFSSIDSENSIKNIYDLINDDSIDNMIKKANDIIKKPTHYFETQIFEAIDLYLTHKLFDDYVEKLPSIGVKYCIHFMYRMDEKEYFDKSELPISFLSLIAVLKNNKMLTDALPASLYTMEKVFRNHNIDTELANRIVNILNFKEIQFDTVIDDSKSVINVVINTSIFRYLLTLIHYVYDKDALKEYLIESFDYFYEKYSNQLLFKYISAHLYPFIYYLDKEHYADLFEYVFCGENTHGSFECLAYSTNITPVLFDQITSINEFKEYLFDYSNPDDRTRRYYATRILFQNCRSGLYDELALELINKQDIYALHDAIDAFNNRIIEDGETEFSKYGAFFKLVILNLGVLSDEGSFEIDQTIRVVSKFILLSNGKIDSAWELLFVLSEHFKSFFSDECKELVNSFKTSPHMGKVKVFLDNYFKNYKKYSYYHGSLEEVYSMVVNIPEYHQEATRWYNSLIKEDCFLINVLKEPS